MQPKGTVKFKRSKKSAKKAKKGTIYKCPHGTFVGRKWGSHTRWHAGCKQYGKNGKTQGAVGRRNTREAVARDLGPISHPARKAARSQGASAIFNPSSIFHPGKRAMKGLDILSELGIRGYTMTQEDTLVTGLPSAAEGGFLVSNLDPGAIGAKAGIQKGDVIMTANEKPLRKMVSFTDDASPFVLTCISSGKTKYIAFEVSREKKKGEPEEVSVTNGHIDLEKLPEMIKEGFETQNKEIERLHSKVEYLEKQVSAAKNELGAVFAHRDRAIESLKKSMDGIKS